MKILIVNVGSTSLKFKLYHFLTLKNWRLLAQGKIVGIGNAKSDFSFTSSQAMTLSGSAKFESYEPGLSKIINFITDPRNKLLKSINQLGAVGFKTVHGGSITEAAELTPRVLKAMEEFSLVAPAHNPPYIKAIRTFRQLVPNKPLIGLFEPAFHVATMPEHAYLYGVPMQWHKKYGIRRYGFHGASHRYIAERVPEILNTSAKGLKIISCHLGGSSSLAAIKDGKSIDTSMGFSPQSGVLHSTRPDDFDPFVLLYLLKKLGWTIEEAVDQLSKQCGMLGLSGISGQFKDIETAALRGNKRAKLTVDVFVYGIRKFIGSYIIVLGGLDCLVFTGGIGEHSASVRSRICQGLEFLGIKIDRSKNKSARAEADIGHPDSKVSILVIPTNEELIVARATYLACRQKGKMINKCR